MVMNVPRLVRLQALTTANTHASLARIKLLDPTSTRKQFLAHEQALHGRGWDCARTSRRRAARCSRARRAVARVERHMPFVWRRGVCCGVIATWERTFVVSVRVWEPPRRLPRRLTSWPGLSITCSGKKRTSSSRRKPTRRRCGNGKRSNSTDGRGSWVTRSSRSSPK